MSADKFYRVSFVEVIRHTAVVTARNEFFARVQARRRWDEHGVDAFAHEPLGITDQLSVEEVAHEPL